VPEQPTTASLPVDLLLEGGPRPDQEPDHDPIETLMVVELVLAIEIGWLIRC
jgi:hypothetical protein